MESNAYPFPYPSIKAGGVETILMVPSDPSRSRFQWDMMHMDNLQHKMSMRLEWKTIVKLSMEAWRRMECIPTCFSMLVLLPVVAPRKWLPVVESLL